METRLRPACICKCIGKVAINNANLYSRWISTGAESPTDPRTQFDQSPNGLTHSSLQETPALAFSLRKQVAQATQSFTGDALGEFDNGGNNAAAMQVNNTDKGDGKTKADPKELSNAADALVGIRSQLRQADDRADDMTRAAGRRIDRAGGWKTPAGLATFTERWNGQVKHLHDRLADISRKLHDSGMKYTRREQQESANQEQIRKDFG